MTLVHSLKLPSHLKAESFAEFAQKQYFPDFRMEQTRAGLLREARLLRNGNAFLLVMEWDGVDEPLPHVSAEIQSLFNAYDIEVDLVGEFHEVAHRRSETF